MSDWRVKTMGVRPMPSDEQPAPVIRRVCFGCNMNRLKSEFVKGKNRCARCLSRQSGFNCRSK